MDGFFLFSHVRYHDGSKTMIEIPLVFLFAMRESLCMNISILWSSSTSGLWCWINCSLSYTALDFHNVGLFRES